MQGLAERYIAIKPGPKRPWNKGKEDEEEEEGPPRGIGKLGEKGEARGVRSSGELAPSPRKFPCPSLIPACLTMASGVLNALGLSNPRPPAHK